MKAMELEQILDHKVRKERERSGWKAFVSSWVKMWRLDAGFGRTLEAAVKSNQEQITTPAPFNAINKAMQLISSNPRTDVLPDDPLDSQSNRYAQECERFLNAFWKRLPQINNHDPVSDSIFNVLVKGRFALDVRWVKPALPKARANHGLPLLVRSLDPLDVGYHYGPYYTEFVYHLYRTPILNVLQMYPELRNKAGNNTMLGTILEDLRLGGSRHQDWEVDVLDFWYIDPEDGEVWNAICIDDEFAPRLWKGRMVEGAVKTGYPDVPIIVGRGDYGPGMGDEYDGLSLLHPMNGTWQYQCRLMSQRATGLMRHYWGTQIIMNDNGEPVDDIEILSGEITPVPPGTHVEKVSVEPNVAMAQEMYGQIDAFQQQSTFPEVLYGKAPGELQAGYGVSILADSAKGRIKNFKESLERGFTAANRLILAQTEAFGGEEGISLSYYDRRNDEKRRLTLNAEMINGNYQNEVKFDLRLVQEMTQKQTMLKALADGKYISRQTLLDQMGEDMPENELQRINLEELMLSDEMRNFRMRRSAQEAFKETMEDGTPEWAIVLATTPFLPPPPEGMEWDQHGRLVEAQVPPPMPPPEGGAPTGPYPAAGPPAPPVPPPPPPLQPPAITPPTGGGIPPEMQGQMTPELMGLPSDLNPIQFAQMMNAPLPPAEEEEFLGRPF